MAGELESMSKMKLKRDVLDKLDETYQVELPAKLVEAEFEQIWQTLTRELEREKKTFADEDTTEEEARKEYTSIAERRVRLGLVLGTIGESASINVTEEELQQALMERVRQFPGQERQVYDFYRKNPNAMMELRGPIFEQKVVDHIVAGAKVNEKTVSREELQHAAEHERMTMTTITNTARPRRSQPRRPLPRRRLTRIRTPTSRLQRSPRPRRRPSPKKPTRRNSTGGLQIRLIPDFRHSGAGRNPEPHRVASISAPGPRPSG